VSGLETALAAAALAWHVIPCGADKRPLTTHGLKDATTSKKTIREWWAKHPDALPAVVAGPSGLAIADFDVKDGRDGLATLARLGHPLPATWRQRTPSGGSHAFYLAPEGVEMPNGTAHLFEAGSNIDRRTGQSYAVLYASPPTSLSEVVAAPEWLTASEARRTAPTQRATSADEATFRNRLASGKSTKAVKKATKKFRRSGMDHGDLLTGVTRLVRLGVQGHSGVRKAIDTARERYADGWGAEYVAQFDKALAGSIAHLGLPPVTFALTKAERRALRDRHAAPKTVPLSEGAAILDAVRAEVRRFVALPGEPYEVAVTLWAAHTHLIACFDSTPRLSIQSPDAGSGKTRLLEVLAKLVHDSVETMNTTTAFLARRIDSSTPPPTVLFDEVDTVFGVRARDSASEELRGILNSGHRRGAKYSRAATRGKEVVLEDFETFAPVAMAGLGELPDTIRTRSVIVPMRRRSRDEIVEPYRERQNGAELEATRDLLAAWARTAASSIGNPWPEMPYGITDRPADVWEPLLAVADAAGGDWPALARDAAVTIVTRAADRPASLGIRLLADVRRILEEHKRMRSIDLLGRLIALEDAPWSDLGGKGPIDSRFLGRTFDGYGIPAAHTIRFDAATGTAKGWTRSDFADAWARYLPVAPATTLPLTTTTTKEHNPS
jgi:hypothetical protein